MKRTYLLQLSIVFIILQLVVGRAYAIDRTQEISTQAYVYAYPMVLMEITRRVSTNVDAPVGPLAPMNQFAHLRAFPDHNFKEVVRPNADTLYSIFWFDVSKEPQVLSISDTGGRYYMLAMLDMWTDVFAVPGSRTSGTKAANFAIVGPKWKGTLPDGVQQLRSPTNIGWTIGRTQTNGAADYENVHRIQDGYKLSPLSHWGKPYTPPAKVPVNSSWDMTPPLAQITNMDAKTYFELFAELLKDNPPHELDWNILEQLKQVGIVPGESFTFSKLPLKTQKALTQAVVDGQKMIAEKRIINEVNGWQIALEGMGNYGTSYLQRAFVAMIGLGANVPEDAIYPILKKADGKGVTYNGDNRYVLHFDKIQLPPVAGFWSLAMYNDEMYFADNPIRRYSIGDRDKLKFNKDGSLDIYIQHASPGKDKKSNWLPAPKGNFDMVLRLYWPKAEILTGDWNPPAVKRVK